MATRSADSKHGAADWVPYQLLGEARATMLRACVRRCLEGWQQDWFGRGPDLEPVLMRASGTQVGGSLCLTLHEPTHGAVLQIGATTGLIPCLLGLHGMSGPAGSCAPAPVLAQDLQVEILRELGEALLQRAGLQQLQVPVEAAAREEIVATRRWHQLSCAAVHSLERLSLLLHPALLEGLAPPLRDHSSGTLVPRRNAVAPESIRIEAWLGEVDLTLSEFSTLRLGDVLVLEGSQVAYLTAHERQRIATLQLGRQRRQRAVSIASVVDISKLQEKGNP